MGSFGEAMKHIGKDKYIFSDGEENNQRKSENAKLDLVYKQIGNAVPVRLALAVAEPIAEWAKEELQSNKNNRADTI